MSVVTEEAGSISIMYVEDDAVTRELVAQTLPRKFPQHTLYTAENGRTGLELYMQHRPDIVITDINMPVMNGILMAGEIKQINPDVVIIAVTAYSETNYLLNAIEIGISHYVLKPIDYRKLFEAIEKSSVGIHLRKQVAEQNKLIRELNVSLEKRALDLAHANRELEAFSNAVSHDLRVPLANVRELGLLLLGSGEERFSDEELGLLRNLLMETERMDHLIEILLQYSQLANRPVHREQVDLSELAREIAAGLYRQEPERCVDFRISEDIRVKGDGQLLRVVMENLLGNAWKYTGKSRRALIEFGSTNYQGSTACFVRDNGVGFDMKQAGRLFHTFQRLHDDQEFTGYGIGLATVQRIIQRHGGRIYAAGEPGKGAVFTFTL
ncbi:response regulator [Geobacter sp. DSM 9736]|uniref:sensor histidine kinase n=1 Tax=Geobacter sp. DSM 9736 TaxID=1277350 RepID=UPI000B50F79E|nr:response regulator [Geobacter sp. DSM 9736]SNB47725.1 hypothetical protein SAMN06269301_3217 [Geobacter sp. DSM 9736]